MNSHSKFHDYFTRQFITSRHVWIGENMGCKGDKMPTKRSPMRLHQAVGPIMQIKAKQI